MDYGIEVVEDTPLGALWGLCEEQEASFWLHKACMQDGFCFRAKRRALLTAEYLLDDKGELQEDRIETLLLYLEKEGYVTYVEGLSDSLFLEHVRLCLGHFLHHKSLRIALRTCHGPVCHHLAEELLRDLLGLSQQEHLTDRHIRKSILSACLVPLRQNVGSCFATAPAILIQREHLDLLLCDLQELLMTGKLKRTFGGVEFSVPCSPSSGIGDLGKTVDLSLLQQGDVPPLGLLYALECVQIIPKDGSIEERMKLLQTLLCKLPGRQGRMRVIDLLHLIFMTELHVTEQELLLYEKAEKTLAKSQGLFGSAAGHVSRQKMQACAQCIAQEKRARAAFQGVTDHALLKMWEFTLASFSEGKTDFAAWNLYASLGLDPAE